MTDDFSLHVAGLETHIEQQVSAGINGLLVAGTMGNKQFLTDEVWLSLAQESARIAAGRCEVLVGVGEASLPRTLSTIRRVVSLDIDGVVAVTPYVLKHSDDGLTDYYLRLADHSAKPVYLYDLPVLSGNKMAMDTVVRLLEHPNVGGIKCSDDYSWTRQLMDVAPQGKRVIVAQPFTMDMLMRSGVKEHLDGIYNIVPEWTMAIAQAAEQDDWDEAAAYQRRINELLAILRGLPALWSGVTTLLNLRGVEGRIEVSPQSSLTDVQNRWLTEQPIVQEMIASSGAASVSS